jgi:hypothetical protein
LQRREYQAHTSQDTDGRILLLWRRRDRYTGIAVEVKSLCIVEYIDTPGAAYSQSGNVITHARHDIYLAPGVRQILIAFGRSNSTIRPFGLEEGTNRPLSASRITSTGFLTTCYNVNTSTLKRTIPVRDPQRPLRARGFKAQMATHEALGRQRANFLY